MSENLDDGALDDLLGAYALDAVDAGEAEEIARYLARSPRARAEVEVHREVAALLVAVGGEAPAGVWASIAAGIGSPPQAPDAPILGAAVHAISDAPSARRSLSLRVATPVLGAAAAIIVVLGVQVVTQGDELDEQQSELAAQQHEIVALGERVETRGLQDIAADAARSPKNRMTVLSAKSTAAELAVTATAVMGDDGEGYLLAEGLPELREGRSYQLWGIVGEATVSLGLLDEPGVIGFHVDVKMDGYAITEEAAGGVATSTNAPLVVGLTDDA